jgi:methanogenic corrinoid protein MtbC1
MYKIGELWEQGKLDVATEHACTNTASSLVKVINEQISHSKASRSQYKILICTPDGELHSLVCNIIESLLISKGFKVYNISPSVPSESIIGYLNDIQPDIILISITIADNIKPAERLIKEIRLKYHKVPIIIGGSGLIKVDDYVTNDDDDVVFMPNTSFGDIIKLIYNMSVEKQIGNNQPT